MEPCYYCGFGHPAHHDACPRENPTKQALWRKGWESGRKGLSYQKRADPIFQLGWIKGEVALETAENTCRADYYEE